jgi:hypothetical protein
MPEWCMICGKAEMPVLHATFENGKWIEPSKEALKSKIVLCGKCYRSATWGA